MCLDTKSLTVVVLYTVVKTVVDPTDVVLDTTSCVEFKLDALTTIAVPQEGSAMSKVLLLFMLRS